MVAQKLLLTLTLVTLTAGALLLATPRSRARSLKEVTFTREVAPILYQHCAACHQPADSAPFSVLTYREVRPWARAIREQVSARTMPPWPADPRYGAFANIARLSQLEIDTIANWVEQGAKEGDLKDLPPPPAQVEGWRIGQPDQIFTMTEDYTIAPDAPDKYIYFTIPTRFKEDKWIQAAELRPGNRRVVHHAIAHILTPQSVAKSRGSGQPAPAQEEPIFYQQSGLARVKPDAPVIDDGAKAAHGGSAYQRSANAEGNDLFSIMLASYAPGKDPDVYPAGMAKRVPAGSTLVLQLHYSSFRGARAKTVKDRSSLGLIFAKEPPHQRVVSLTIPNHFFKIPPGAANHEVTAAHTFEQEVQLIDYMPHMHLRGKDMRYEVIYPDQRRETLLLVPRFNFNWQTLYRLKSPVTLPKGTRLIVTAHFDNSARNKYNPDPTKAVRWGDPTDDEMMIGWLDYVVPISN